MSDTTADIYTAVGLLSPDQMACVMQVTAKTLATWRSKHRGPPSVKLGKRVFYLLPDFAKWVTEEARRQHDTKAPNKRRVKMYAAAESLGVNF